MRIVYSLYCITTFVIFFLLLFPAFLFLSLFGQWGQKVSWRVIRAWSYAWFFIMGMQVKIIYKARPDKRKQYIIVANHIAYLDTAMIFRTIPFYAKPLAKAELAKIPLFGFLYKQLAVLVQRDDDKSKTRSVNQLKHYLESGGSIFIFPEGAFNETEEPLQSFYDGAFRLAMETNTPVLPVIFPDTKQRMHYSSIFKFSPGITRSIFLPEVHPENYARSDIKGLKAKVRCVMYDEVKQYWR